MNSLAELADLIEHQYHEALRRDVPVLIDAARTVERVHAGTPDVPVGLADELVDFWEELKAHMAKEERILFPMIRDGFRELAVAMPVLVMEREHQEHGEHLERIRALTHDLSAPEHACTTWRSLYDSLRRLEAELVRHIQLENDVLFARAVAP